MYKLSNKSAISFFDFNQPAGMHMNPENRWIILAESIPWDDLELMYADLFKSKTGNVAKPLRMALGALIIQKKYGFSDRELVAQITENPYLQYFIGLPGYQETQPFDATTLVLFRKRLTSEVLAEINEYILAYNRKDDADNNGRKPPGSGGTSSAGNAGDDTDDTSESSENSGTLILDATCAPVYIRFPQDISLLNEAREKLEKMIQFIHKNYGKPLPRTYKRTARKSYLDYAKRRKHSKKQIRKAISKQLGYVRRDIRYLTEFIKEGCELSRKQQFQFDTICTLYE